MEQNPTQSGSGTPTWAIAFIIISLLSELLIELSSMYLEDLLGAGSTKLIVSICVGLAVLAGLAWLARRKSS